jgi:septum site-determining protein MinC
MSIEEHKALRLLGRVLTLSRLRVQSATPQEIVEELTKLTLENPMLKQGLPVIIESDYDIDLAWLVKVLKKTGIQILGVANGILTEQAIALDLPILPADHTKTSGRDSFPKTSAHKAIEAPKLPAKMLHDPVRSGAELIADGCIHVYGALRGRAIAGATGNPEARIFCKRLEADLVAIAGIYMVADQISKELIGKSVQIRLGDDGNICIELLE